MIAILAKLFLKPEGRSEAELRRGYGVLCGAVGVGLNLLLFAGKLLAGLAAGSIAAVADAVNNLSDAASSVVTLLGFLLAGQKPDRQHPFGHGRMEYLSGLAVSVLILLMGLELGKSSVERIANPSSVAFGGPLALILCASIGVKLYMALYNRRYGRRFQSGAMEAASIDALGDCAATLAVLLSAMIERRTGVHADGWAGFVVAALILWSGVRAVRATADPLIGTPPSPEFVNQVRELVLSSDLVTGVHDLIVHDYGPNRVMLSLHAEVPADGNLTVLHEEIDRIEQQLRDDLACEAVIHMDPTAANDPYTEETKQHVEALAKCVDTEIAIHDFRIIRGANTKTVIFDAAVPFRFRLSDREVEEKLKSAVQVLDAAFRVVVRVERSYS